MVRQGIAELLRFAAALSDGAQLLALRCASDDKPPTLVVSDCQQGSSVASKPLDAPPEGWQSVPAKSWVLVNRAGARMQA